MLKTIWQSLVSPSAAQGSPSNLRMMNNRHTCRPNSNITVAIMGCAVNGPGEAKHADIGIAGGVNEGLLIKKGEIIRKVKQDDIVEELKKEIIKMTK